MFEKIKRFGSKYPKLAMVAIVLTAAVVCFLVFYGFLFGILGCILLGSYFLFRLAIKRYNRVKTVDYLVTIGLLGGTATLLTAIVFYNII